MPQRERSARPLTAWRIVPRQRTGTAFDGEGARLYGGRWNHPGTSVVYASTSLSLAALEVFVHADPDTAPPELVAVRAELPAGTEIVRLIPEELPDGWRAYPGPESLRDLGTDWARRGESLVLVVPSAIVPQEDNLLLDPEHPAFSGLRPAAPTPFGFDPRMWKAGGASSSEKLVRVAYRQRPRHQVVQEAEEAVLAPMPSASRMRAPTR